MDLSIGLGTAFEALVAAVRDGKGAWILVPTFVGLLVLERVLYLLLRDEPWSAREAPANLASAVIGVGVNAGAGIVFAVAYLYIYNEWRLFTVPMSGLGFVLAFVASEFCHYLQHRMDHRTGLFWAFHSVHHSSQEMNLTVAPRIVWGVVLFRPVAVLMPLLGFSLLQYSVVTLLVTIYGIFNHTRLVPKLGVLEHILVTPSNHRAHHGTQLKYLDCNYGQVLLIFDKLFGTHQVEEEEPVYGLVQQVDDRNPLRFQTNGVRKLWQLLRSSPNFRDKLRYLLLPPGWSHTGAHETTESLRARGLHQHAVKVP